MSFARKALNFAENLVDFVLEHYSKERYRPGSSDYKLRRKARTSGTVVESAGLFRAIVGKAAVFLQPLFEVQLDDIDCAVYKQAPEFFDPVKFIGFCSLVTLEMARDYFGKANQTIPDFTTLVIVNLLRKYHENGTFRDEYPSWDGKPSSSWAVIYETASSIMSFKQVVLRSSEFVPEVSPPSTPDSVLPSEFVPQCSIPLPPFVQLPFQPVYGIFQRPCIC